MIILDWFFFFIPMNMSQFMYMVNTREWSKAEIIFENGKFKQVVIKEVVGKEPLDIQNLKKFKKVVELYRDDIIRKWIDFIVYNIEFVPEKITKKL